jgi:hypothetical protein
MSPRTCCLGHGKENETGPGAYDIGYFAYFPILAIREYTVHPKTATTPPNLDGMCETLEVAFNTEPLILIVEVAVSALSSNNSEMF